jgi:hypothetical protein
VAAAAVALQLGVSAPALAASGDLHLASTTDAGVKANRDSDVRGVSADGTRVLFSTKATNLDARDTDDLEDVYVKDLTTGALILASTSDTGTKANRDSYEASLSADGTAVAFHTYATNLDAGDTDEFQDIYVKDLTTGALILASTSDAGTKANRGGVVPSLSADGTRVAFGSGATNLGEGDTDIYLDVYVKDLATGALTLTSTSDTGATGNFNSFEPTLSADGTRVAFTSDATNFGEGDTDTLYDFYVKDLTTGALTLASTSDAGTKLNTPAYGLTLSGDGSRVAWYSYATNVDEGDADTSGDVYVKDLATGALTLVSTSATGTKGNGNSLVPSLSADGFLVAFWSSATNLGEDDTDHISDAYVKNLTTGVLTLASTSDTGAKGHLGSIHASLSADGTRVAFSSAATNLGEGDTDAVSDAFVKELPRPSTPVATDDSYATSAGSTLTVPAPGVLANDHDDDPDDVLRAQLVTGASHGTVALAVNGGFTYTPSTGYIGSDSFTYLASDGSNNSGPVTVTLSVNPVNVAPLASDDSFSTVEDTALSVAAPGILGDDTDVNGDVLSAVLLTGPSHGTVDLAADGGFSYAPAANYHGADSFTYRATDGAASSSPATVSLTVRSVNDGPVASAGPDQSVAHEADFTLHGGGTDVDGDGLTHAWTQVSGPAAVIRDPDSAETVVEGVPGAATLVFRLTVTDPSGASSSDEVTVTVKAK